MRLLLALLAAVCAAGCFGSVSEPVPAAAPAVDPDTVATLTGQVTLAGTPPPAEMIRLDGDPKCVALAGTAERPADIVLLGDGNTLQNVFVYVKDGLPQRLYPIATTPVILDQQQCRYVPRVLGVQVGQALTIANSDPLMHNVRAEAQINQPFDLSTPLQGIKVQRTFSTRELMVPVKCNVHGWMHASIGVLEHPFFAVTDGHGRFTIPDLPPGSYTIEIWHEKFGTQTQQVTVAAKDRKDLTFSYTVS